MFLGHQKLFGASCAGCGEVIPPSDVVRRAHENIYHMKCFACVMCGTALNTGDEFYLRDDGQLICKTDFHNNITDQHPDKEDGGQQNVCQGQQPPPATLSSLTFTPQETAILQEIYNACPNPSHDTLQRISSQHGLDMTRVRVWFHVHRKEKGARDDGTSYSAGHAFSDGGMERAVAPPGGYPLPIVNEASSTSSGRLPVSSRSDLAGDVIFPLTPSSLPKHPCVWPLSDDVWRPDFVPPNVDLNPCDIKNGEVCDSRRGVPPRIPSIPSAGDEFCFVSPDKGGNCQQEQLQRQGEPEVPLSWINC